MRAYDDLLESIIKDASAPGEMRTYEDIISDTVCALTDTELLEVTAGLPALLYRESARDNAAASAADLLECNLRDQLEEDAGAHFKANPLPEVAP